jgi:hypothetical protein
VSRSSAMAAAARAAMIRTGENRLIQVTFYVTEEIIELRAVAGQPDRRCLSGCGRLNDPVGNAGTTTLEPGDGRNRLPLPGWLPTGMIHGD